MAAGDVLLPKWNVFFMSLSLFMAISGAFTAIQFVESLIFKGASSGQHTSKKGSALFSIFAASWCIGVNCVWVMHFLAMSAVTFTPKPMKYNLGITVVSLIAIFVPTFIGLLVLTFHRNSVVYAKRLKMAAAVAAAGGTSGAATASAPGTAVLVPQGSKAQLRAAVQASDLHGSLEALLAEIVQLLMDLWAFLSLRLLAAAVLMGSGVVFMHFTGMAAIRASGLTMTMNRLMMWLCFPIAWIGAAAALFLMFHMHGLRRRLLASVVIGIAVNLIHYFGFFSMSFVAVDDLEPPPSTETLVYSENACVFVSLLSSLARFFFMGVIAATSA